MKTLELGGRDVLIQNRTGEPLPKCRQTNLQTVHATSKQLKLTCAVKKSKTTTVNWHFWWIRQFPKEPFTYIFDATFTGMEITLLMHNSLFWTKKPVCMHAFTFSLEKEITKLSLILFQMTAASNYPCSRRHTHTHTVCLRDKKQSDFQDLLPRSPYFRRVGSHECSWPGSYLK